MTTKSREDAYKLMKDRSSDAFSEIASFFSAKEKATT